MHTSHLFLVILILLPLTGFSLADSKQHHHAHHHHKNIGKDQPVPTLRLYLYRDAVDGFNLFVDAQNFSFTLPATNEDLINSEHAGLSRSNALVRSSAWISGHAHLYIDEKKIGRIYSSYLHLPRQYFARGIHRIRVNLNDDNHLTWAVNDKKIEATLTLDLRNAQTKITSSSHFAIPVQ